MAFSILHLAFAFREIIAVNPYGAQVVTNLLFAVIYAGSGLFVLIRGVKTFDRRALWPVYLIAFCALSAGWSIDRNETLVGIVSLLGSFLLGLALFIKFKTQLPKVLVLVFTSYLAFSFWFYLLGFPATMYFTGELAFQAFSGHKNQVGAMAGIAAVCSFCMWRSEKNWTLLTFLISILFIIVSRSSTALVATVLTCGLIEFSRYTRRSSHPRILFSIGGLLLVLVGIIGLVGFGATLLDFLGEDRTLSSRTKIWSIVMHTFSQRPLFGVGQSALWSDNSPATYLTAYIFSDVSFQQAHNGYLQVMAEIGVVGLTIFVVLFLSIFLALYAKMMRDARYTAFVGFMFFTAIYNFGEATFLVGNYIFFVLIGTCAAAVGEKERVRNETSTTST
ncbi:O-antigen ligase family protein [Qipengyuania sp. XHP0211]|uniref:O-antigen ligase family protein n=1 Tax=Qipengyuania sp. XHP0211 TaxID=3038079 RepID=UPI00241CD53F|nr:O-antigen ligase family protein [Qipengyuania sp. XHP0211]MDG5750966.1 O-antigen ligase family protein [Qipengyuania sp. XHP0211]